MISLLFKPKSVIDIWATCVRAQNTLLDAGLDFGLQVWQTSAFFFFAALVGGLVNKVRLLIQPIFTIQACKWASSLVHQPLDQIPTVCTTGVAALYVPASAVAFIAQKGKVS